jgi:putative DNA primase/helicase
MREATQKIKVYRTMNQLNQNKSTLLPENIPQELKALKQWVLYRIKEINGRLTKPPYRANGRKASSTDSKTWCTFEQAVEAYKKGFAGIGFVFTEDDPYCGIDFDHCVNLETKVIESWAMEWIGKFASYTEYSPSGTGIHIIVQGQIPSEKGIKKGDYEMYDHARYFTFTGDIIEP